MSQTRLRWLLALMVVLIVVRLVVPNPSPAPAATVQAVERPSPVASAPNPLVPLVPTATAAAPLLPPIATPAPDLTNDYDVPGNAFAIHPPPVVLAPPPPPKTAFVAPPPAPPVPAPPPPPPFQVIGTWDDVKSPGVFVGTPNGTVLARKGSVLTGGYLVTAITLQQLVLEQQGSKREVRFNVPRATGNHP